MHILLLDSGGHAARLVETLHAAGFGVTWLVDGIPGAPAESARARRVDAVLVQVPPGGLLTFKALESAARCAPGRPIVLVGDCAALSFIEEAVSWGVDDYLLWPCAVEDLTLRLMAVVRRWRAREDDLDEARCGAACASRDPLEETIRTADKHLATVAFYCGLLAMVEELPGDVRKCLLHLSGDSTALRRSARETADSEQACCAARTAKQVQTATKT